MCHSLFLGLGRNKETVKNKVLQFGIWRFKSARCKVRQKNISGTNEQINRPSGTGPLFSCFQALRARLLSFGPSGTGYALSLLGFSLG
jgi:hypothetical protein